MRIKSSFFEGKNMKLYLSFPRGFCAGVVRAIKTVEKALLLFSPPIYIKHEIVHNRHVVDGLKKRGVIFVEDLSNLPFGAKIIYSAHGVSPNVREIAKKRGLYEIDATCPLVEKIHSSIKNFSQKGYKILLIGHKNHVEVVAAKEESPKTTTVIETIEDIKKLSFPSNQKLFYVAQTTLNIDDVEKITKELKKKYPQAETLKNSSICYATKNRQSALKAIAKQSDIIIIVGDKKSSNSNRLKEIAEKENIASYLINGKEEIKKKWLENVSFIGMSAGASTPEYVVQSSIEKLKEYGLKEIEEVIFIEENVSFSLPSSII